MTSWIPISNHHDEDDYYESMISGLYKPKEITTIKEIIATQIEIPFEVEQAPEPEPAPEPAPEPEVIEEPHEPTTIEKLKAWLNGFMKEVAE